MKKIISILMAVCILAGVISGCGGSSSGGGSGNVSVKSVSLPDKIANKKIRVMAYEGWEKEHGEIRKNLKDWYGAEVEYIVVDWKEQKQKLAVDLAANITYDVVPSGYDLILNKLVQPLDKYFDLNDKIFKDYKNISDSMVFDGKLYGVPSVPNMEVIIYNKDLIEGLGYDLPLDLYNSGKWNWDTFKQLATGLAKEKTPGGDKITGFSCWDNPIFLAANDTGFMTHEGQKFSLNLDDPKFREALNFTKELSVTGGFTGWQGWSLGDFQIGNTAMVMDRFGNKTHFVSDLSFNWDFVPVPTGPSGSESKAPGTIATYGIPTGSKNVEGGAAYIYLFCKQDYDKRKEYLNGYLSPEQVERFEALYPKINRDYDYIAISDDIDPFMWSVLAGEDITSLIESHRTKWQGDLETYLAGLPK